MLKRAQTRVHDWSHGGRPIQRRTLAVVRAFRSVARFGPWARVLDAALRLADRPMPAIGLHDTAFVLDSEQMARNLERDGYALGLTVQPQDVHALLAWSEGHSIENAHLENVVVGRLARDPAIIDVAHRYLLREPALISATLQWRGPRSHNDDPPWKFHYDVGPSKSVVVSFFLTNATADDGGHAVIKGTHHKKSLNEVVARRMSSETASRKYADRIRLILGPAGTGFFEDLAVFHTSLPRRHPRVMLQLEFARRALR